MTAAAARHIRHEAEAGVEFVVGDLVTGDGLEEAVEGAGTILHLASSAKGDAGATRNLVQVASGQPSAPHLVYISIVGVDEVSFGYMRSKLEAERVVSAAGLSWTILRATQFYDLIWTGARRAASLPLIPVPAGFLVQPIDAGEVADRLVELALGEPSGRAPDLGGPQVSSAAELIRTYLRAAGRRRRVVPVWVPGLGKIRAGGLLADPASPRGRRTWEDFLAERLGWPATTR